jgi:hypothetical protein
MIGKLVKFTLWGACAVAAVFLILVAALLWDWDRSSTRKEKDSLILQKPSPDGKLVAEIHTFTTAMWGGPDTLYVAIRQSDRSEPEKVYSRTYECGDFSAFGLEWETPEELTIKYGECNPSPFAHTPAENAKENKIWQQETSWNGVTIRYDDARREATR